MDISQEAYGGIVPQSDEDAAAKFALSALAREKRALRDLASLLTAGSPVGEVEGVPGWSLERRDEGNTMPGYAEWPDGAAYRASVDPLDYALGHPEQYYDRATFHALVRPLLAAYARLHPDRAEDVEAIRKLL